MNNTDLLLFEDQLSDEELIIQKSAREYCQSELMPEYLKQIVMSYLISLYTKKWDRWDFLVLQLKDTDVLE